jgi:transglutaminase-like putative cysteine protease
VFLLVPRGIGLQEWGDFARPRGQLTGFTEEVEPGAGEVISTSQVAIMEVVLEDKNGRPMGSTDQPYYLRGSVLERYDAARGRWSKAGRSGFQIKPTNSSQALFLTNEGVSGTLIHQRITELTGIQGDTPMFALYLPVSLRLNRTDSQDITYDTVTGWVSRHSDGTRVTYDITSIVDPSRSGTPKRAEAASFPSQPIHDLAAELLRRSGYDPDPTKRTIDEDGRASRVLETYLRANYEYTLAPGAPPAGQSPTEYFLFTLKRGHCEYFASALAAMCRSVGIEARVVAGYLANEYHPDRRGYIVRASDAHAWVEVNTGTSGWQRRDATPAETLRDLQSARGSLWSRLQSMSAAVQDLWNSAVVTFDQSAQQRLLGRSAERPDREILERSLAAVGRTARRVGLGRSSWAARIMVLGALFLCSGLVWAGWRATARRVRHAASFDSGAMTGAQRRVHRELLALLDRRGFPKPAWAPPLRHVRSLAAVDPALAGGAGEVVELLYRSRFGRGGAADLDQAWTRLRQLRRAINGNGKR